MKLTDLDEDCLLEIFSYCSESDLLNLCDAHEVFNEIINNNIFYSKTLDILLCGHRRGNDQSLPRINYKNLHSLSYANRLSIGRNWVEGRYYESEYFPHRKMFATKIHLDRDFFFCTYTRYLRQYRRLLSPEPLQWTYHREISTSCRTDIANFVKKDQTIFAARVCGNCFIYDNGYITEQRLHPPKEYMHCVDFARDMYASSSELSGALWRRADELGLVHLDHVLKFKSGYKVFRFTDDAQRLYGGIYTDVGRKALREIDMETGFETYLNSNTISIYDIKLKNENVLFTAHFDTTIRMYDRRSNMDVTVWDDPFDSSFYCIEYDGLYALLCGTKYHGRVNLYDIRVPRKYVQLYFPRRKNNESSPVYSLACDSRYLFVATDHSISIFDFKADSASSRDHRNIFNQSRYRSFFG